MNCATPALIVKQRCLATKIIYFRNLKGFCCTRRAGPSFFFIKTFSRAFSSLKGAFQSFEPWGSGNFFIFILIFFYLSKIYVVIFILQICHPAARSSGGSYLPPDEPAVSSLAHSPSNIPPFHPAVATYRRMNWR